MKIAHIIGIFSPEHGGPVVSLRNYAIAQVQRGHEVSVYTVEGYPQTSPAIRLPLEISQYVGTVRWPVKLGASSGLRRKILEGEPADIYHLHGIWLRALYYGYLKAKREKRPYLIEINGALDPLELATKPWRKRFVRRWFQDKMLDEASCIHVNSVREAHHVRNVGFKTPIVIIPAGFNQREFTELKQQSAGVIPAWASGLEGRRIFLYLARIHRDKGIDDLLAAWAKLSPEFADWTLLIVGPGRADEIQVRKDFCKDAGIESRCIWAGFVSDVERAWAYTHADFYVLPSHKENFGNTVQEALGYGTPVLTTRATPWLELEKWQCGWVCDDNPVSLIETLSKVFNMSTKQLREMGAFGRDVILKKFSLNDVAEQQIETYNWLNNGPPPGGLWAG